MTLLEQAARDLRATERELDLMGWHVLDYFSGQPQELSAETRRKWAQKSRYAWMSDPMAGAAVDLMNDFMFGRGVPKPRAKDEDVQTVLDEFWDDPDNQRVLTSYEAQVALGTDLTLQSNVFILMFDEGDDGKIKLGLLNHDEVFDAVPDPDFRQRVLYYVAKNKSSRVGLRERHAEARPDERAGSRRRPTTTSTGRTRREPKKASREDSEAAEGEARRGAGSTTSVMNRTSEMVFGVPVMQRTLRWFRAYNEFMASRVDMIKAAAAFIMKRKVKGTPNQLDQAGVAGDLAEERSRGAWPRGCVQAPPHAPGSIANENENAHARDAQDRRGAGEAAQDALMLRAQVSAATRFPQHYLGDAGSREPGDRDGDGASRAQGGRGAAGGVRERDPVGARPRDREGRGHRPARPERRCPRREARSATRWSLSLRTRTRRGTRPRQSATSPTSSRCLRRCAG